MLVLFGNASGKPDPIDLDPGTEGCLYVTGPRSTYNHDAGDAGERRALESLGAGR
jgi:hypothetical protein